MTAPIDPSAPTRAARGLPTIPPAMPAMFATPTLLATPAKPAKPDTPAKSARTNIMKTLWARLLAWWLDAALPWLRGVGQMTAPVWRPVRTVLGFVTPLGWTVLAIGVASWVAAHWLGWRELAIIAAACLIFFIIGALFSIGRMQLAVDLEVTPKRVTVGQPSMAHFELTNTARAPMLALGVELPVGISAARYTTPPLAPGASYEDWVTIPTSQRGVVSVGPVRTQRGDPFGMVRRQITWTQIADLYIHPVVTPIDELGTGLLRDLEGQTTQDVSASDLAFHALRDYIPGDDQRYIHWKSSARMSALAGEQKFLVRQFLDTRRSHVAVVTDVNPDAYTSDDEFELALSCGASVAVRTITDGMDLSVVCGSRKQTRPAPYAALDTYSLAQPEPMSLGDTVQRLDDIAIDASLMVLVTGPLTEFRELQLVRTLVPMQVRMVFVRVELDTTITLRETNGFAEVRIGRLEDLPRALRGGVAA